MPGLNMKIQFLVVNLGCVYTEPFPNGTAPKCLGHALQRELLELFQT